VPLEYSVDVLGELSPASIRVIAVVLVFPVAVELEGFWKSNMLVSKLDDVENMWIVRDHAVIVGPVSRPNKVVCRKGASKACNITTGIEPSISTFGGKGLPEPVFIDPSLYQSKEPDGRVYIKFFFNARLG